MRSTAAICTVRYVSANPTAHRPWPPSAGGRFLSPSGWLALDWIAAVVGFVLAELEVHAAGGLRLLTGQAVLSLLASLPVGLRRRFPLWVVLLVGLSIAALDAQGKSSWALSAMLALAAYTAALQRERRRSIVVCTAVAIVLGVALGTSARNDNLAIGIVGVLGLGMGWVFGDSVSVRRVFREQLAEHEEVEERQRAGLAVRDERMRIARELHDGVAHSLAVITVQAGAARRLLGRGADVASRRKAGRPKTTSMSCSGSCGMKRTQLTSPRHPESRTWSISLTRSEQQEHRSICTLRGARARSPLRSS